MGDARHSRRDFLRGKAALTEAADVVEGAIDAIVESVAPTPAEHALGGTASPEIARRRRVVTLARRAMACEWELRLVSTESEDHTPAGLAALDVVERVEDRLTVYRDTSDLIELNRAAADGPAPIDGDLLRLLRLCDTLHRDTDGAFDPTSGPLSRVWGFHRREGRLPSDEEIAAALETVGWLHVAIDEAAGLVRFDRDGVELNSNSIGKGWALDRAGEVLAERGVADSLMHGGRSTLLARGSNRLQGHDAGWKAGVRHPLAPDRRLAEFTLHNEAFSTSGSGTQFFEHEGRRYGHVIDPRTGWPSDSLYSVSLMAPTAAEADALSTAAFVLGIDGTAELCRRRPGLRALVLAPADLAAEAEPAVIDAGVAVYAFAMDGTDWRARATPAAGGAG
ncbi:MAG: FAD:protein FMN transferase [Planctomycetota bacterium]